MPGQPVKFGVNLNNREPLLAPDYTLADLLTLAERAEDLGFDSVWVGDSLFSKPRWEPINLLSAISQRTSRVKLGAAWRHGEAPLLPGELAFDFDGIAALLHQAETEDAAIARFLSESGSDVFKVVYEAFAPRYEETVFDLLRWMGIEPPPDLTLPNPRTVKLADDRTDEWVERFRELQSAAQTG